MDYDLKRVNHQVEFCSKEGVHNNLAESYNFRFKRMVIGHFNYANKIAYREDMRREEKRRKDNATIFTDILFKCLHTPPHRDWRGYWQGNHKQDEILFV